MQWLPALLPSFVAKTPNKTQSLSSDYQALWIPCIATVKIRMACSGSKPALRSAWHRSQGHIEGKVQFCGAVLAMSRLPWPFIFY